MINRASQKWGHKKIPAEPISGRDFYLLKIRFYYESPIKLLRDFHFLLWIEKPGS